MSDIDTDGTAPGPVPYMAPAAPSYVFLLLPWVKTAPVFNKWFAYSIYGALEANFVARRAPADVMKLIDGSVAYRMDVSYLPKFPFDTIGYYVDLYSFGLQRFVTTDPTATVTSNPQHDTWLPVGNA